MEQVAVSSAVSDTQTRDDSLHRQKVAEMVRELEATKQKMYEMQSKMDQLFHSYG